MENRPSQVANSGVYTCEVRGIAGPASNSSILTVLDPLFSSTSGTTPPSLVSPTPPSQSIPIGQTAQFVCAFTGFPEPTIEWTRDNSFLPNLKRVRRRGVVYVQLIAAPPTLAD